MRPRRESRIKCCPRRRNQRIFYYIRRDTPRVGKCQRLAQFPLKWSVYLTLVKWPDRLFCYEFIRSFPVHHAGTGEMVNKNILGTRDTLKA